MATLPEYALALRLIEKRVRPLQAAYSGEAAEALLQTLQMTMGFLTEPCESLTARPQVAAVDDMNELSRKLYAEVRSAVTAPTAARELAVVGLAAQWLAAAEALRPVIGIRRR
jgi:hypothetical protein